MKHLYTPNPVCSAQLLDGSIHSLPVLYNKEIRPDNCSGLLSGWRFTMIQFNPNSAVSLMVQLDTFDSYGTAECIDPPVKDPLLMLGRSIDRDGLMQCLLTAFTDSLFNLYQIDFQDLPMVMVGEPVNHIAVFELRVTLKTVQRRVAHCSRTKTNALFIDIQYQ